ncbi:peptide-N(4)-(N-acetyl-beta-glucosaminyl)asparagine amidase isoform X2 [Punica granatum]|nr:peptide-N(4)-(N-acetyl-beta-glucosaminyl)asparagine amidase isoform X2 [Punica granatum]
MCDKLQLVSIDEEAEEKSKERKEATPADQGTTSSDAEWLKSDEELARMLQAEEEALLMQQYAVGGNTGQMEERLRPYIGQVQMYEDPKRQEAARRTVPLEELEEKALVSLAKEGKFKPSKAEQDQAFLLQLLYWFKQSFRWVNAPSCESCGSETISQGMGSPVPSELLYGASRVELYRCRYCLRTTRFPRYNDPLKLLETRRGRCGEWANCFTLYCRAFGYDSRLVLDFTDHVWTECFSEYLGRWMHLDSCEAVYDKPLLYEKGWNKKLNYAFGIARDGVYDVTKRYTRKWHEVLTRRNLITESALPGLLNKLTGECRRSFPSQALSSLVDRERREAESLERDLHSSDDPSVSLPGRQSGDKQWRMSRAEIGPEDNNSSVTCSSCPVRTCMDEHVTRIYNSLSPLLSHFAENPVSQLTAVEVLITFKELLMKMRSLPFKTRRVPLDSLPISKASFVNELLPSFDELLNALSLKLDNSDGKIEICLAGDPVRTALVLPVVLDALDDAITNLKNCKNLTKDILCLPLVKVNRIHSGSVLASGEEIPLGIATSAFDGTRETKWEEPNGAKGCWLIYKVPRNKAEELVAYELMSANDVPERDPMDWVIEGSDDSGDSWRVLDRQTSQLFENRFQRKTFLIKSTGLLSNAFRFRFLAVRDSQSNPRLQIGSIDLYARGS